MSSAHEGQGNCSIKESGGIAKASIENGGPRPTVSYSLSPPGPTRGLTVKMLWFRAILGGALAASGVSAFTGDTTAYIDDLFDQSMSFLDQIYDPYAGYLWWFYQPLAAGKHETRSTVWYAAGLLRRNEGDDVDNAVKIITNVIGDQQKNVSAQWYEKHPQRPPSKPPGTG